MSAKRKPDTHATRIAELERFVVGLATAITQTESLAAKAVSDVSDLSDLKVRTKAGFRAMDSEVAALRRERSKATYDEVCARGRLDYRVEKIETRHDDLKLLGEIALKLPGVLALVGMGFAIAMSVMA